VAAAKGIETITQSRFQAKLFDLLAAYARQRQKSVTSRVVVQQRAVWSLAEAREALERLAGIAAEWTVLDDFLLHYCVDMQTARTIRASALSASLEMVREGRFDMRQDQAFAPLWVRRRAEDYSRSKRRCSLGLGMNQEFVSLAQAAEKIELFDVDSDEALARKEAALAEAERIVSKRLLPRRTPRGSRA